MISHIPSQFSSYEYNSFILSLRYRNRTHQHIISWLIHHYICFLLKLWVLSLDGGTIVKSHHFIQPSGIFLWVLIWALFTSYRASRVPPFQISHCYAICCGLLKFYNNRNFSEGMGGVDVVGIYFSFIEPYEEKTTYWPVGYVASIMSNWPAADS